MPFANFTVFSLVFRFWVAISGDLSLVCHVVVGPLVRYREGECVANEYFLMFFGGGASSNMSSGRATPWKKRTFDSTMGFPGEDVVS